MIEVELARGVQFTDGIEKRLKKRQSTISREVKRYRIRVSHYLPEVAQIKALMWWLYGAIYKRPDMTVAFVELGLDQK
ncbi:hypothetical protein [Alteromonas gracilis]|uniref:hypothetical protein n=1 Tax=Alteromonas gracilis TaxID=1479524 RepID=UPI00321AA0C6